MKTTLFFTWLLASAILLPQEGEGGAIWLDAKWEKRVRIRVENPNAIPLKDHQVRLEVLYRDGMRRKFQDLRFTAPDGVTPVSHWLETVKPEEHAVAWIKAPLLSAGKPAAPGVTEIWLYYGNPDGDALDSFDKVFTKLEATPETIGLWHFDDGSNGGEAQDVSPHGNAGKLYGKVAWEQEDGGAWGDRKDVRFSKGHCLRFDGDGAGNRDYIAVENAQGVDMTSFTVEGWVKPMDIKREAKENYSLFFIAPGHPLLGVNPQRRPYSWYEGGPPTSLVPGLKWAELAREEWHHLVSTFDARDKTLRLYVNAVLQAEKECQNHPKIPEEGPVRISIGGYPSLTFNGMLDEMRFLKHALSDGEILADYQRRKHAPAEPKGEFAKEPETRP